MAAPDITSELAVKTAAGGVSAVLAWAFHITPELLGAGLIGSMVGMAFIKTELGALRAAVLFVGYAVGAAIIARWAVDKESAQLALTLVIALTGHPLVRVLLARATKYGNDWADRILGTGAKKP